MEGYLRAHSTPHLQLSNYQKEAKISNFPKWLISNIQYMTSSDTTLVNMEKKTIKKYNTVPGKEK